MLAQVQVEHRRLRRRLKYFFSRPGFANAELDSFTRRAKAYGELAVVGGLVRDLWLGGVRKFRSDVDFVIHPRNLAQFDAMMAEEGATLNRFGGYRLSLERWKVDIWPLQRTWAAVAGHRRVDSFEDLLGVTFFNWDAAVYSLTEYKLLTSRRYFDNLDARTLSINLEPNPNPLGNAVRALRYAYRWRAQFTRDLAAHVLRAIDENGMDTLLKAEFQSFSLPLISPSALTVAQERLRVQLADITVTRLAPFLDETTIRDEQYNLSVNYTGKGRDNEHQQADHHKMFMTNRSKSPRARGRTTANGIDCGLFPKQQRYWGETRV
jgi:hypothetical protein